MTIRIYRSYDESSLRTLLSTWRDEPLSKLAALFNYRNHPSASDHAEVVVYRNTYGDLFEINVNVVDNRLKVFTTTGAFLGIIDMDVQPVRTLADAVASVELLTRQYSEGLIACSDCRTWMRRFSPDIVLAYHGGRYCATCAPKYERLANSEID